MFNKDEKSIDLHQERNFGEREKQSKNYGILLGIRPLQKNVTHMRQKKVT